jgi:peptide-methionine (R)-S-oxide reductase
MFESEVGTGPVKLKRRALILASASAVAGLAVWSLRKPRFAEAAASKEPPQEVTIVQFSDAGDRRKRVRVPKVVKSEDEWRKQLSANVFDITRHADTEFAYSGKYWSLHDKGLYRCICCDNALFSSETKFDSGTGWRVSGNQSRQRTFAARETSLWGRCGLRFPVPSVMHTLATCSMMVPSLRTCDIA